MAGNRDARIATPSIPHATGTQARGGLLVTYCNDWNFLTPTGVCLSRRGTDLCRRRPGGGARGAQGTIGYCDRFAGRDARKRATSSAKASGASMFRACPRPGMTTTCAFETSRAKSSASAT